MKILRCAFVCIPLIASPGSAHAELLQFTCKSISCGTLPSCHSPLTYDVEDDDNKISWLGFEKIKTESDYVRVNYSPGRPKNYLGIETLSRQTAVLQIRVVIFERPADIPSDIKKILGIEPVGKPEALTVNQVEALMPRIGKIEEVTYGCVRQDPR